MPHKYNKKFLSRQVKLSHKGTPYCFVIIYFIFLKDWIYFDYFWNCSEVLDELETDAKDNKGTPLHPEHLYGQLPCGYNLRAACENYFCPPPRLCPPAKIRPMHSPFHNSLPWSRVNVHWTYKQCPPPFNTSSYFVEKDNRQNQCVNIWKTLLRWEPFFEA